ncbi:MAG: peptidoglycan editing factor PgeF [Velocimicrobium sp.]
MINFLFHSEYDGESVCEILEKNGVYYIQFKPYQKLPFLVHGFSTRLGGVSKHEFSSMNLSYQRGDKKEYVNQNYEIICKTLDISKKQLVFTNQVHDTRIQYADGSKSQYQDTDALVTDKEGIVIVTSYADCVPLYFVDKKMKIIGFAHSGWRGTVGKIGLKTIAFMIESFGCKSEDIIAVIGPSICKDCYEISEEVAIQFEAGFSKEQQKEILFEKGNGKYQLDLWKANQWILLEAGLKKENIHIAGLCTCCNHELFFSHRATGGKRGNLNGFLGIR